MVAVETTKPTETMKTSTPQQPKLPSPLSILLIGPPGGGKTTLAMQFPSVFFMDCDANLDGPERLLRSRNKDLSYSYESMRTDDDGKPVAVEEAFDRLIDKLDEVKNEASIKTVVIDSLTHVNEFIIRNVLRAQNKAKNPYEMELRDWIPFKSKAYQLLVGKLQGLGKTTICTCHERILTSVDAKDVGKERVVGYQPAFQGGVTDYFGGFFTDMWRCETRRAPGGQEFIVVTRKTPVSDLKCSIPSIAAEVDVTKGAQAFLKQLPL